MSSSGPSSDDVSPVERRTGGPAVASGESLNLRRLVGRGEELGRLSALLAAAADGRSGVLLVEGEPGAGKTALLEAARGLATGFTCLAARGVESEMQLAHAGLLGLLSPVRDLLGEVPPPQAAALGSALGWSSASAVADRFLVGAATLSLLASAAERGPVLVLVDDLQWLDRESVSALAFAARRLGPDAVAVVLTTRTGAGATDFLPDFPTLRLRGLSVAEAEPLLPDGMAGPVRERLVAETGGNPLALLEVSRRMDHAQMAGAAPLPSPLPAGDRLRGLYRATVEGLGPEAWRAVLRLALDPDAGSEQGEREAGGLDEARTHGVVVRDGLRHDFRHPLLRSAVLERATAAEQRAAHADLAASLPVGSRAQVWHRAASVSGPDVALAAELTRVAEADRDRLGYAAASLALERASSLTPDPDLAAQRLAAAAHDAFLAGDVERVRRLAARVLASGASASTRGEVLFTSGMLEQYAGSVPSSVVHLREATSLLDGVMLVRALHELGMACFRLNDVAGITDCARRIDQVADPSSAEQKLLGHFTGGFALVLAGDFEQGTARLTELRRLADLPELRHDARVLLSMALAAGITGQVRDAVTVGAARLEEVRRRGAIGVLVPCLAILAAGRAWLGDHTGAFADAGEAADLATHLGYSADASLAVEMLAWQQAARGLHEDARSSLARARELTDRAGTSSVAAHQALTSAFCALCRGDAAEVVSSLEPRLAADGGVGAGGEPLGVAPLLVEAYVALGRVGDARALTDRYADVVSPAGPPLTVALLERCRLVTAASESDAAAAFDAAMQAHRPADDPFESARTRLLFGSRLRRTGERVAARTHLEASRAAFEAMDLTHWADVASAELAATGATARRGSGPGAQPLTSQETRVALLAAQGLSNREIGASLFLSPKTIERHLSSVFRKRGFRSRTELAVAFARSSEVEVSSVDEGP